MHTFLPASTLFVLSFNVCKVSLLNALQILEARFCFDLYISRYSTDMLIPLTMFEILIIFKNYNKYI